MAKKKLLGTDYLLLVDTVTSVDTPIEDLTLENFKPAVCLTSNGVDFTVAEIETTSKCDGDYASSIPGTKAWSISGDGVIAVDTDVDGVSTNELFKLIKSGNANWWAIMNATELDASPYIRVGVARLNSLSDSFPDKEGATFTLALTGIGELYDQDDLNPST